MDKNPIHTHNDFHLGDNLVVLHFLRHLALENPGRRFVHGAHECHLPQLRDVVADIETIRLVKIEERVPYSMDLWKNAGAGTPGGGYWERHPTKSNFVAFHLDWFASIATRMGLRCPFSKAEDLLFDYPALPNNWSTLAFDFLVINSRPCSGQLPAYDSVNYLDAFIQMLARKGYRVVYTQDTVPEPLHSNLFCTARSGLSVSEIAGSSLHCPNIIGVATGPMWPTFNIWNRETVKLRIILLGNGEVLDLDPHAVQASNLQEVEAILKERGLL